MRFLPIVERELRVAARQRRTWWRRVLTMAAALVIFAFVYLTIGQWQSLSAVGQTVFAALSVLGMIYALLAGPLTTVDCLSRERREGTLGLLFLTDLRSTDVVLGKLAAASLNIVLDLTAALPVVAIPILMGGVSLTQLALVVLALVNMMFLSLATGVVASAAFDSGRSALAFTFAWLFFLSLGLMFVGMEILNIHPASQAAPFFYFCCPVYTMMHCLSGTMRTPAWPYWLNMAAMHLLGWACLFIACWRTANSWRGLPESRRVARWREWVTRWKRGSAASRLAWRSTCLSRNPVSWLEGRDQLPERLLWGIVLGSAVGSAIAHLRSPRVAPNEDWLVLWPMFSHYIVCFWIAIQAPRRLADDKQSGALELLLCTPITPREMVRGIIWAMRRRFGRALLVLMALDLFLVFAYFSEHGGWHGLRSHELFVLSIYAAAIFPLQGYSLARIGLCQGLVQANSGRATAMTIWKVGLLPWVLFIGFMVTWDGARRYFQTLPQITDARAWTVWAGVHLLACVAFLAQANWRLARRFRELAGRSGGTAWWIRAAHSRSQRRRPSGAGGVD